MSVTLHLVDGKLECEQIDMHVFATHATERHDMMTNVQFASEQQHARTTQLHNAMLATEARCMCTCAYIYSYTYKYLIRHTAANSLCRFRTAATDPRFEVLGASQTARRVCVGAKDPS